MENETHNTLDTAFTEDDYPWIEANENRMLAVAMLRRVAFPIAAIFRGVTQRSEERRATPWKTLLRWFTNVWIGATAETLAGLRQQRNRPGGSCTLVEYFGIDVLSSSVADAASTAAAPQEGDRR